MSGAKMPVVLEVEAALEALARRCGDYAEPDKGYTYAVRQRETGLVKIGQSTDPLSRIGDLQSMNGGCLEVVGICHWTNTERLLHGRHAESRRHGEWFAINVDPMASREACLGCETFGMCAGEAAVMRDIEAFEVPDVPVTVLRDVKLGTEQGHWYERGEIGREYLMHGGGRIGAISLATAVDRKQTAINLALLSAARTGSSFLFEFPGLRSRLLDVSGHATAWEFWPGMSKSRSFDWFKAKSVVQKNLAELETLEAVAHLFVPRTEEPHLSTLSPQDKAGGE